MNDACGRLTKSFTEPLVICDDRPPTVVVCARTSTRARELRRGRGRVSGGAGWWAARL